MRRSHISERTYYCLLILSGCITLYALYFHQINEGFSRTSGDAYDGVIEAFLISHWHKVATLQASWNQSIYFFPHADTLGYNDSYFLYGLIATAFRLMGCNFLVSQELCHITVKAIGFFSMAMLLNKLQDKRAVNVLGAVLFTLMLNVSIQSNHGQLLTVAFAPLLALMLLSAVNAALHHATVKLWLSTGGFIISFSACLMTSYYMTWFFGLFVIIFVVSLLAFDARSVWTPVAALVKLRWFLPIMIVIFIVSLAPFLLVYLPALRETGGQSYSTQLSYSLQAQDILNTGSSSLVWRRIMTLLNAPGGRIWRDGEYQVGLTPELLATLLAALIGTFVTFRRRSSPPMRALACAVVVGLVLPVSFSGHSPWFLVDALVPGARGVRVIARFYLFLSFPICVLIALYLGKRQESKPSLRPATFVLLVAICICQLNVRPPLELDVRKQMALLDRASFPPSTCKSFYVINPLPASVTRDDRLYRQNVEAMALADHFGLPTLNGYASFNPSDWIFDESPSYPADVATYISKNGLSHVCQYDIAANAWKS